MPMDDIDIRFLIQHIILPPKLPQEEPEDLQEKNFQLLKFVSSLVQEYATLKLKNTGLELDKARKTLEWMVNIHNPRNDFKVQLQSTIRKLRPGDAFALEIVGQNAGIIFRRIEEALQLESFEVSPLPEAVVKCKGRLQCTYPGPATIIPWPIAQDFNFLEQLGEFLHHMGKREFSAETLSKSRKGGNDLSETRSTADPRYIVELFTGMMRGIGEETTPRHIIKSIRDEANWNDASKPWRRSGLWLVIRVLLQTTLSSQQYKLLMLEIIRALLDRAIDAGIESYLVSCASKKLARRCQKIESGKIPSFLLQRVNDTLEKGSELLKNRWGEIIGESTRSTLWDSQLGTERNLTKNMHLSLPYSLPWIERRLEVFENPPTTNSRVSDPTENDRSVVPRSFPQLGGGSEVDIAIKLIDFEIWVDNSLVNWCSQTDLDDAVQTISSKIQEYHKEASSSYKDHNILNTSRMILTILEMWVCLDKLICDEMPLMRQYSPEIPQTLLEPLLFVQKRDIQRVNAIEHYLIDRHSEAESHPSIFNAEGDKNSFASKYYATDRSLPALRERIIAKATRDRAAKIEELATDNSRHAELSAKARRMTCDYHELYGHHLRSCTRCSLIAQADRMSINVHEWPLPEDETQARCILFELQSPKSFTLWRDTTYYIMVDVCFTDDIKPTETTEACSFDQWNDLCTNSSQSSRITWASTAKPISLRSHYRSRKIPADQSDVVVKHAGRFRLRDTKESQWVESKHKTCTIKPLCRSKISDSTYKDLSYAVNDVVHTHNETIARQSECPASLTLREYDAFATLRSGRFLQWHNILLEMHKRDLSFNKDAIYVLIMHAVCHLGKATDPSDWRRDSHITLSEEAFSQALLKALQHALRVLEDNWEQATALKLLVLLAQRLVSCGHQSVRPEVIKFLREARGVCDPWIKSIEDKIENAQEEKQIEALRTWLLRIAGIQCSTFDIDQALFGQSFQSSKDVIDYLVCQNTVYDNCLGILRCLSPDLALLLEKNRRFSLLVEPHIQDVLKGGEGSKILSSTIRRLLPNKEISGTWTQIKAPATRWWVLRSTGAISGKVTVIHFNILEGKLLVDGKPNGRLPVEYFAHGTYKRLLGKRILDVIPSEEPGMSYETKRPFCGIKLHFHLQGEHLIIRKHDGDTILEFISSSRFRGDIPQPILHNGTQWLDLNRHMVVFYQTEAWWDTPCSSRDWTLDLSRPKKRIMSRNTDYLLDIHDNVYASISQILGPIEDMEYIVATATEGHLVSFDLPRYKLEFFLNGSNYIESRSLRGWIIDPKQKIGCFIGLKSFLKLRLNKKDLKKESILVPFGKIEISKANNEHALVKILPPSSERSYTVYPIDRVMNRIVDDGTLKARYTRLYLHAICSGILPDPLTGRSGVNEALDGLRNAASFSFQTLQDEEAEALKLIANLTPNRDFYPRHLKVMQQIRWRESLPAWVQNDNFYPLTADIFNDWSSRQFLLEGSKEYEPLKFGAPDLLERARYQNSVFDAGDAEASNRALHSAPHVLRHSPTEMEAHVHDIASHSSRWDQMNDLEFDLHKSFAPLEKLAGPQQHFVLSYSPEIRDSDPIASWCGLYNWCKESKKKDRFALLFTFCSWVYIGSGEKEFLKSLITIAASGCCHDLVIPPYSSFQPSIGLKPQKSFIENAFKSTADSFESSPYSSSPCSAIPRYHNESNYDYSQRRRKFYQKTLDQQLDAATDEMMKQSSATTPADPKSSYSLLNVSTAMKRIRPRFETCHRNRALLEYFNQLKSRLIRYRASTTKINIFNAGTMMCSRGTEPADSTLFCSSLSKLLLDRSPPDLTKLQELRQDDTTKKFLASLRSQIVAMPSYNGASIRSTILQLIDPTKPFTQTYANDLFESVKALEESQSPGSLASIDYLGAALLWYKHATVSCLQSLLQELQQKLSPQTDLDQLLETSGLWPTLTKLDILQELRLKRRGHLSQRWRKALVCFGEAVTWLQRSNRLHQLHSENADQEIQKEIWNSEAPKWSAHDYVDWLLFEIDSEMLIRPVQAEIGRKMMSEEENGNAVMQLNMGEGKSAVIMPVVAAALADTTRLVRPIVLKPLSTQMFQILVQRLSGLCDRRIYFLPFHRGLVLDDSQVSKIRMLYKNCRSNGDILLSLPEHLLSFKLMGLEKLIQGNTSLSEPLIAAQKWLDKNTRDILDESDEILHIRYQLIYTMGQQEPLEGDQDRWTVIQDFLACLQKHISSSAPDPTAIEVLESGKPQYPTIRIIDKEVGEKMLVEMAKEICIRDNNMMPSVSSKLRLLSSELRKMVFKFIAVRDISLELQETILQECEHVRVQLLVLRGLIADGIILFILRDKRYRVDYGLDTKRSNLAVPYRAKDRPAVKAEFGHPEVVLTLTCLTYYYGGLDDAQLANCFELLFKTDDPDLTYEHWTLWTERYKEIPTSLSQLRGLNLLDQDQLKKEIFPFFRYNKHVIDFFLSELIFPREAKGFPHKLSMSGWDLAQRKNHNTTGFSGTNDNRYLLPTSINQLDLPQQLHTNSLVLMNILREENNSVVKTHKDGQRLKANEMLGEIVEMKPKIRVLLDVGAQILELTNYEVAREWLYLEDSKDIQGAVFFGENDDLLVMKRDGKIEPFASSNLSKQLDQALVYLDEAHTRGTDLKLPVDTRAAVTLGPNLAKDKFVQGCMRMRKLGNGHSLTFLASPDIYDHIQKTAGKSSNQSLGTSDVLLWTMQESCRQIQHGFAIWADQGFQYLKRQQGWESFKSSQSHEVLRDAMMEAESRPLIEMYGVSNGTIDFDPQVLNSPDGKVITKRLAEFSVIATKSVRVQEEQEREVDHEVEQENDIERPQPAKPKKHSLAQELIDLVKTGKFNSLSLVFKDPFRIFATTSCRDLLEPKAWRAQSYQFTTRDFAETIERTIETNMDDYLRPVRWVVEFYKEDQPHLIFISPYEANELMPDFKISRFVQLHCYAPRVSRSMSTFERFDICPVKGIPQRAMRAALDVHSRIRLNLFAGQLFFESEQYYNELCEYLSLSYGAQYGLGSRGNDGWVLTTKVDGDSVIPFSRSPIPFLRAITKMRRKGQGFASTHLGGVLDSRVLGKDDFR